MELSEDMADKTRKALAEAAPYVSTPVFVEVAQFFDRLSPPAPEVDEATVWARKVIVAWAFKGKLAEDDLYLDAAQLNAARAAIAELIASKDGEIAEQKLKLRAYKGAAIETQAECDNLHKQIERLRETADKYMWQVRDTCTRAEKAESKLEESKQIGVTLAIKSEKQMHELAALRAENERLKGEPSEEMYEAGYDALRKAGDGVDVFRAGICLGHVGDVYRAMVDKATSSSPVCPHCTNQGPNCPYCGVIKAAERNPAEPWSIRGTGYDPNCDACVASKFTCDEHSKKDAQPAESWSVIDSAPVVEMTQARECVKEIFGFTDETLDAAGDDKRPIETVSRYITEAEARGRREALMEAYEKLNGSHSPLDELKRLMTEGK